MSDSTCSPKSKSGDNRAAALDALLARLPACALSSIATISKGKTGIKDATPGQYPLVVTAEARGSSDHFDFEGPGVMIPMVSSTGHGDASLKRVHYQDGQYAVGSILAVVQPKDPEELSARYLHAYLSTFKDELLVSRMVGTANVSLTVAKISGVPIPLIPISAQRKIEELMALCDRLEARQADADSAHAQLVQALLGSLTQASDAEDFAQSWQRLAEHFHTLLTTESSIDALKQALLQLAVMGKLVPQDPSDEPAGLLMARLRRDRSEWLIDKQVEDPECKTMLRKLSSLTEALPPFPLPESWITVHLIDCSRLLVDCHNKTAPYVPAGTPIIRTSNIRNREFRLDELKYVNEETCEFWSRRCPPEPRDIIFTREAPMGEAAIIPDGERFCLGQRTMLVRPMHDYIDNRYLLIALTEPHLLERASTYAIGSTVKHLRVGDVELLNIPLPPLAEQHRIVAKLDQLMVLCDQLKSRLSEARQVNEHLANTLIGQALNSDKKSRAEAVDFSAYLISKLASRRTFGRVAHMKLLFLADSHLGLGLMDGYRRHAAGPLDTTIYRVEEHAAQEGLYSTSIEVLKSGQEKVSYHIGANISRSVEAAASALGSAQKELDRLIALFEGRKTDDLEAVATLYAVWNDALTEGLHPNDEWLINEFRSNWHEAKERFAPDILGKWLDWMRDNGLVPTGNGAVTKSQAAFLFN
ncbi:restriction endonuclease subunit S [Xanthomonas sp. MWU16-30325]|uniref:restriction endonuclease subunit S n=1 Tax=Xanthomonas sp. MWU16-30325 TaxID=2878096 RepID=UPI001CF8DE74|nr:restriction endonuclease subunit S [Xanthomonas sp. MWU16-30325]